MPTEAQLAANRANAQLCTGPRTEAGKARSSQNAMKDGLFASHAIVSPHERPYYEALTQDLWEEMFPTGLPSGPSDLFHYNQIALAMWNLNRAGRLKTKIYEETGEDPLDPQTSAVRARFEHLDKSIARLERTYNRFFRLFRQHRSQYEKQLERDMDDFQQEEQSPAPEPAGQQTEPESEVSKQNQNPYDAEADRINLWLRTSIYTGIEMGDEPEQSEIPANIFQSAA